MSDPQMWRSGWDLLDELVAPLNRDGIPFVLVIGIPGTDETRTMASNTLDADDVACFRAAFDHHFEKRPPAKGDGS